MEFEKEKIERKESQGKSGRLSEHKSSTYF